MCVCVFVLVCVGVAMSRGLKSMSVQIIGVSISKPHTSKLAMLLCLPACMIRTSVHIVIPSMMFTYTIMAHTDINFTAYYCMQN